VGNWTFSGYRPPVYQSGMYYYNADPFYRPCHYGHWVFGSNDARFYRRSVYFYFGFFQFIEAVQVHPVVYRTVSYYDRPVVFNSNRYYLEGNRVYGLEGALQDIQDAWLTGRANLLTDRVESRQMIAVMLDGKYDYSVTGNDYAQMTVDAIQDVDTVNFTWDEVRQRTNGDFTAFARHTYRNASSRNQTTYVSYTLRRIGGEYMIVEVGSSDRPLN
jgi:hypothetical protein